MGLREWFRRVWPRESPAATAPATPVSRAPPRTDDELVAGLRVDPRTKILDFADLETTASGPGFSKLSIPGVPAWADAIAKRRAPDEPMAEPRDRVEPVFDERAVLSCSPEAKLALGPAVRAAILEALVHSPAVRLGEGRVEAIVPAARASERAVQDAVLTIARSFTGSDDVLDRILRWALEDDAAAMRRACVSWLVRNAPQTPRTWDVLRTALGRETDDATRLEIAAAMGIDAANVVEQMAESPRTEPEIRARAVAMMPSVFREETRLDRILVAAARDPSPVVQRAALDAIATARRPVSDQILALLPENPAVADALIELAEPGIAKRALEAARPDEAAAISLRRIRIAAALGGREVVEPLRVFLTAGRPMELARPTRAAIEEVKARLTNAPGAVSVAEPGAAGRLSPASSGGELSRTPAAGALSDPSKKRS